MEMPWPERVPIMRHSMTGGTTAVSAAQRTRKLAPNPPLVSLSGMKTSVEASGFSTAGAVRCFFNSRPPES